MPGLPWDWLAALPGARGHRRGNGRGGGGGDCLGIGVRRPNARELMRALAAAVLVGVAAGVAGAALTLVLHLVQHLAVGYTEDTFLVGVERASDWRRVAAMTAGGFVIGIGWWLLRRRVDAEQVSVTRALRGPEPRLPLVATLADAVLQIIGVGVGGSLGREGAPRQAGAALAEFLTRRWALSPTLRRTLVACGAGAGLAAVYNVPLAGALFALEVLLVSCRLLDIVLAVVSSVVATVVAWPVLSARSTYHLGPTHLELPMLVVAAMLGPVAGLLGVWFVRATTLARTHARSARWTVLTIPGAFAAVGALGIAYPELLGNGKGQAQLAFAGLLPLVLAGSLVLLKPVATAICLAGGAIGGLLTPSLATGAALGAFAGDVWAGIWPGAPVVGCAVIGAATLLSITQRAPVMAVTITVEFLHAGIPLLGPIIVAVTLGVGTATLLDPHMRPTWSPTAGGLLRRRQLEGVAGGPRGRRHDEPTRRDR